MSSLAPYNLNYLFLICDVTSQLSDREKSKSTFTLDGPAVGSITAVTARVDGRNSLAVQ